MVFFDSLLRTRSTDIRVENLKFKLAQVDPRDMLNNFCFHLYAENSLFIAENGNGFLDLLIHTLSSDIRVHRAGSQLKKMSECQTKAGNLERFLTLTIVF